MNKKGQVDPVALESVAAPWLDSLARILGYVAITTTGLYFILKMSIFMVEAMGWCIKKINQIFQEAEDSLPPIPPRPPKKGLIPPSA